jgi:hypothetical protein
MHVGFCVVVFFGCHPNRRAREVSPRELFSDRATDGEVDPPGAALGFSVWKSLKHFGVSLGQGAKFLGQRGQRTLLLLLIGASLVEFVTESYDGKMIVKHVLHGSDDAVRYTEIVLGVVGTIGVLAVPALTRWIGSIGRVFLFTMVLDGVAIMLAGRAAHAEAPSAIVPFVSILAVDHSLTLAGTSLVELAQNSASSAAMRGRIAGTLAFFVIVGDMVVEGVATTVSEAVGIPAMLVRVGALQIGIVLLLLAAGRGKFWNFGLREVQASPS